MQGNADCPFFAAEQEKTNKVENLLKAMRFCQLFSLVVCLPVLLSLPLSVRDQTNLTSGLKVQLTQTRASVEELVFVCPFKYLKPKTSMDLKTKGNLEGQVQVTEKLCQK